MTQAQATQLDSAIDRALEHGIEVMAHGHAKQNNARIWCTNSHSQPDRWHVVMLVNNRRLVCDCKSTKICAHRAAVHMELVNEAAKQREHAAAIEAAMEEEARVRDSAALVRSNAAISIFK